MRSPTTWVLMSGADATSRLRVTFSNARTLNWRERESGLPVKRELPVGSRLDVGGIADRHAQIGRGERDWCFAHRVLDLHPRARARDGRHEQHADRSAAHSWRCLTRVVGGLPGRVPILAATARVHRERRKQEDANREQTGSDARTHLSPLSRMDHRPCVRWAAAHARWGESRYQARSMRARAAREKADFPKESAIRVNRLPGAPRI